MNVQDGIIEGEGEFSVHVVIDGISCPRRAQMIRAAVLQEVSRMLAIEPALKDMPAAGSA